MRIFNYVVGVVILGALTLSSCIKKDFDNPPNQSSIDPAIATNATIAQLSNMGLALSGATPKQLGDTTIYGIVTADDRSGNYYKQIIIQDSTGGIALLIDQNSLYNDYPVGRKVYLKLKGLYLVNYKGTPEIAFNIDNAGAASGIPSTLVSNYIIKASYPNTIAPVEVTIAMLSANPNKYINRLVKVDSVEFAAGAYGVTYAQPSTIRSTTQLNMEDCSGSTLTLSSSGYANFQTAITPAGKGSITGIYSLYNGTGQLEIRDTTDVQFTGSRCDGSVVVTQSATVSLDSVRKLIPANAASGSGIKLGSYTIKGVVTGSSLDSSNFSAGTVILQDGNRGISLYYGASSNIYHIGDSLLINITGDSLLNYKGSLEIKYPGTTTVIASGRSVAPAIYTTADISANYYSNELEYTLVKIVNCSISNSTGTYNGNSTISDGTGTLDLYTGAGATFKGEAIPTTNRSYTGIISNYSTSGSQSLQLQMRYPGADVQ